METRLDAYKAAPQTMQIMLDLQAKVTASGLEHSLQELVKIRASQINGCAFCLHMHTQDARKAGETEARIYLLDAWRESPLYTDRERAALAWTEALTVIAQTHAPDETYALLASQFSEEEQVKLTLLITTINAWNRFAIGFRKPHPVAQGDVVSTGKTVAGKSHVAA
jgi:AhpD family alkylhydroperoxidase